MANYDVIIAGVGAMGSAAAYQLARRGKRVLGLERFDIPHAMGSSHGVNRIIRLAYYEDPSYVPLLRRAYELWRELQSGFGEQLLHITGSIDASERDSWVFARSLASCIEHDLPHEILTAGQLHERFPGYQLPEGHFALLQPEGGFVASERAIVAHVEGAIAAGAEIHGHEQVLEWETTPGGVRVTTNRGSYEAEKLVISAGAWVGSLAPQIAHLFEPERQVLAWFQPSQPALFAPERFPVFNLAVGEERLYGFPIFGIPGFKFGKYHHRFETIDPDQWQRDPEPQDEELLRGYVRQFFPAADGPVLTLKSCIFTNTPDEHFVLDTLPDEERVIVASPCSGHGYKFASVMGEIIADLAVDGATQHNIDLFKLNRFAATPA